MFGGRMLLHVTNANKYDGQRSFGLFNFKYLFFEHDLYLKSQKHFLSYGILACKIRTFLL